MLNIATWEKNGIYWKCYDTLTLEEIITFTKEMLGDSNFNDLKYFIWDASNIKNLNVSNECANAIASINAPTHFYKPEIKAAFVAEDNNVISTFERFISTLRIPGSTWEFQLFSDIESARKWALP